MINEFVLSLPLVLVSIFAIAIIVLDAFIKNKKVIWLYSLITLIILFASSIYTLTISHQTIKNVSTPLTKNMLVFGSYSAFFDLIFIISAFLTILSARSYIHREYIEYKEFYSLTLLSLSGMMFIAHANNLLILFLGIEIMSVSFYVLAGYFRTQIKSVEAAVKYFLLGAFATAFLLYGIAMVFGATSSVDLTEIAVKVQNGNINNLTYLILGIGLMLVGLSFKVASFPFHQWAPDVYHGSPTVVTGYMSTAGKSAALVAFIIIAKALLPAGIGKTSDFAAFGQIQSIISNTDTVRFIIALISALTMLIGNFTALIQKNVKRMLAYSSVAHAGYMLMGIVANNADGWTGILYYSTAYLFMQLGAFLIISIFERNYDSFINFDDYSGLSKYKPLLSASMAIFMFSLAGLPPFAGFFGKYFLFKAAIETGYLWLSIIAIISSIISMYYYIGLVLQMYFKEKEGEEMKVERAGLASISIGFSVAMVFLLGIFSWFIVNLSDKFFK